MPVATNKLGLLFAEVDSAGLLRLAGDRVLMGNRKSARSETEWLVRQKVAQCRTSIADIVHHYGGVVSHTQGDRVLCHFADALSAFDAACAMQTAIAPKGEAAQVEVNNIVTQMGVRVSIHYGHLDVDAGLLSGIHLDILTTLLTESEPDQILCTQALLECLPQRLRKLTAESVPVVVPGRDTPLPTWLVDWRRSPQYASAPGAPSDTGVGNTGTPAPDLRSTDAAKRANTATEPPAGSPTNSTRDPGRASETASGRGVETGPGEGSDPDLEVTGVRVVGMGEDAPGLVERMDRGDGEHRKPHLSVVPNARDKAGATRPDATSIAMGPRLLLRYKGQEVVLDRSHRSITLRSGQERTEHAKISLVDDGFLLENLSVTGTYVRAEDGTERHCTDSQRLSGVGTISLGAIGFEPGAQSIEYSVQQ